ARQAGRLPADQADGEDVRTRRRLRDGKQLDELERRPPALPLDHDALHLRHHRRHAAEGEEREHAEVEGDMEQRHSRPLRAANTPQAAAIGMTSSIERRPIPTATKQAAISASAAGFLASARPSLIDVPMKSPAPVAPTPVTTSRTTGCE